MSRAIDRLYRLSFNPFTQIVAIALFVSISACNFNMGTDEGVWSYIARVWMDYGIPPYIGALDNKPPAILIVFAFCEFFSDNILAARLLGVIAVVLASIMIYPVVRILSGKRAGILAMALFGFTMSWHLMDAHLPAATESFMVAFTCMAVCFIVLSSKTRPVMLRLFCLFCAGMAFGFAVSFKQVAVFSIAGIILFFFLLKPRKWVFTGLVLILIGFVTATVVSFIPLYLYKIPVVDYWKNVWLILLESGKSSINLEPSKRFFGFFRVWQSSRLVIFYPFMFLFFVCRKDIVQRGVPFGGIVLWFLFDFIGTNISGYYYGHQLKQIVPSIALMSALGIDSVLRRLFEDEYRARKTAFFILLFIFVIWIPYSSVAKTVLNRILFKIPNEAKDFGKWIEDNTLPGSYVYIFGRGTDSGEPNNQVMYYSNRLAPSRYFNPFFMDIVGADAELMSDFRDKPPELIIVPKNTDVPEWLNSIITERYFWQSDMKLRYLNFEYDIYRKKP